MEERCLAIEDLEALPNLPADDPRRRHLETCAACRALAASYREFMTPGEPRPEGELRDARRQIGAALAKEMDAPRRGRGLVGWLDFLTRPALRPAWGMIAVLAVVLIGWSLWPTGGRMETDLLRGNEDATTLQATASLEQDGRVVVTWLPVADATDYAIILIGEDLEDLARLNVGTVTSYVLPPEYTEGQATLLWRLVAYQDGEEMARSSLQALEFGESQ